MARQESGGLGSYLQENFAIIVVVGLFTLGGFFIGSLWTENQMLRKGTGTAPTVANAGDVAGAAVPTEPQGPSADQLAQMPAVSDADYIRGNRNAKVVLVEYSDYECPFCARFHPTMLQVMDEFGDEVAWVYRDFPLSFHPNAQKSAEGAECVGKLGGQEAFWSYTDALFKITETEGSLSPSAITDAAATAGVDASAFKSCLDSGEMAGVVTEEMNAASAAGISGTPGTLVVVDGEVMEMIPGALPFAQVKSTIEKYL